MATMNCLLQQHELKIWPEFFQPVLSGEKSFEIRENDRGYKVGDRLWLREWEGQTNGYSGQSCKVDVTYILTGLGLLPGWVALGIKLVQVVDHGAE